MSVQAMVQWEYQVIRLNVEPPVASAPPAEAAPPPPSPSSGPAPGAATPKPAFSEAYLRQEFPRYYDTSPSQAQPRPEDPGAQLQAFFNGHGQQGWELVGFQHAAPHVFIVFKRPKDGGSDGEQHSTLAAQQEQLRLTLDLANRALAIIEKQA
jgi:hypothetical protein